ncbi:hypothetical protein CMV_019553 [Castanea mollissima]|uniref:Uncharacterized protein n=1 Tax=Castanea mollissima TaxID=60419 RepID=A0A8J4VMQ6_9ROSI|nr:hypothetical protein CMV_019553 [Castanea mollissima]
MWRRKDEEDSGSSNRGVAAAVSGLGIGVCRRPQRRWSTSSAAVVEGDNGFGGWWLLGFGAVMVVGLRGNGCSAGRGHSFSERIDGNGVDEERAAFKNFDEFSDVVDKPRVS